MLQIGIHGFISFEKVGEDQTGPLPASITSNWKPGTNSMLKKWIEVDKLVQY